MEVADLVVVNKSDGDLVPAARHVQMEYVSALKFTRPKSKNWRPEACTSKLIILSMIFVLNSIIACCNIFILINTCNFILLSQNLDKKRKLCTYERTKQHQYPKEMRICMLMCVNIIGASSVI